MSNGSKQPSSTFHLLAGTASGFTTSILLQPFDLLKTRVQQYTPSSSSSAAARSSYPILNAFRTILSQPAPLQQLWRGTLPSVIRTSAGSGLYFASLERLRRGIADYQVKQNISHHVSQASASAQSKSALPKLGVAGNLITGATARASVGFLMMPITVLKVRFESTIYTAPSSRFSASHSTGQSRVKNPYTALIPATREILRTEGMRGFFKGAGATAVRDAPYAGIYLGFYESCKSTLTALLSPSALSTSGSPTSTNATSIAASTATSPATITFLSGAFAGALATGITNPPDVIKTRLQLMPLKYTNALQTVRIMVAEEGWKSLWGGLGLRVGRKALSSALAWTVYEEVIRRIGERSSI
ncbi:MAG: hypothetical protein Q9162_003645 [Coniocarpon cinnabarinum]